MTIEEATSHLLSAQTYFDTQSSGYKSWGNVEALQVALKVNIDTYLVTNEKKALRELVKEDIELSSSPTSLFQQIFGARKDINAILITHQQYASKIKEEIPAILDDQAQLLGVTVRIAKSKVDIVKALSGRYAAILPDSKCICLGSSIDDAYVAAQLLEKTAKAFTEASYLGGARPINKIEAWFMQQYYRLKYSKEAVKNK